MVFFFFFFFFFVSDLRKLRDEIADISPATRPSYETTAAVIVNTCQKQEFEVANHILYMNDDLPMELAIEHLRGVKQDKQIKDSGLIACNGRNISANQSGQSAEGPGRYMSQTQCYGWAM